MYRTILNAVFLLILISCNQDDRDSKISEEDSSTFISAVDISSYPEISISNPIFYEYDNQQNDFLAILKTNGVNTIRLRLWVNPESGHSGFEEVKQFSNMVKAKGFKTWLTLHYSDTWADPGNQITPIQWQGIGFAALKDSVFSYTKKVVQELQPDFIQIGNEINSGFLHPQGNISTNIEQFLELIATGIKAVRTNSNDTEIILHFAGIEGSEWFYNQVNGLDYDIIGLSYYPIWHGKSFENLKNKMVYLSEMHDKKIMIAETAYPFTLDWDDLTNNIVGLEEQLVLPDFPASPNGQKKFINQIKVMTKGMDNGIGFCYWGAELIGWKGTQSTSASSWENQALFDFNNKALPVLSEFKVE